MKKFFTVLSLLLTLAMFPQVTASTAVLNASPTTVYLNDSVRFDGSGSDTSFGNITKYYFDYGDGFTSGWIDMPAVEHLYQQPGTYNARLKVKDIYELRYNQESSWSTPIIITVKALPSVVNEPPLTIGLVPDPGEISTGGERAVITVILLRDGEEVKAPSDIEILLNTTLGRITSRIIIHEGESRGTAFLESYLKSGTAEITATSKGLEGGLIPGYAEVEFTSPPEERAVPRPPRPRLVLESDASSLPSDGESTATIKVGLVDDEGNPVPAEEDTTVYLKSTGGRVEPSSVTIKRGGSFTTATFVSPKEPGVVRIFAASRGFERAEMGIETYPPFVEVPDPEVPYLIIIILLAFGVAAGAAVLAISRKRGYFKIDIKPRLVKEELSVDGETPLFEKPEKINNRDSVPQKTFGEKTAMLFSKRQMDAIADKALENTSTPLRFRLANFLAGPKRINDDKTRAEIKEFFKIDIYDLLIRIWKNVRALKEFTDREKYPCENTYQLTLLTHKTTSKCEFSLDVFLNKIRILRIPFELDIELDTDGFRMWIRCGRITRIFSGNLKGTVSIRAGGFKIIEEEIGDIKIPGEVSFEEGFEEGIEI